MLNSDEAVKQQDNRLFLLPKALGDRTITNSRVCEVSVGASASSNGPKCEASIRLSTIQAYNSSSIKLHKEQRKSAPSAFQRAKLAVKLDGQLKTEEITLATCPLLRRSSVEHAQSPSEDAAHDTLLNNIKAIAMFKLGDSSDAEQIIHFAEKMVENYHHRHLLFDSQDDFSSLLGKIIFLIDQKPETIVKISESHDYIQSAVKIRTAFDESLRLIQNKLSQAEARHLKTGLPNEKLTTNIQLPIEISRILIPSTGIINYSIIPKIIREFITGKPPQRNYPHRIQSALNLLLQSEKLRKKIQETTLPKRSSDPGALLVKITLNLPPERKLTNVDAMQTALAAFLTHHRQGRTGSCFAAFLAIGLQKCQPEKTVDDFQNLISKGKLTRTVEGEQYSFPYLLRMGQEELKREIQIDATGTLITANQKAMPVWEIPSAVALCRFLGLKDPQVAVNNWLSSLPSYLVGSTMTVDQLIEGICNANGIGGIDQARLAYCSTTSNPLLSSWENTIAGMAEARKNSLLQYALIQTTSYFVDKISKNFPDILQDERKNQLKVDIEDLIHRRAHYLYDPAHQQFDKSKVQGAFILYDNNNNSNLSHWKRIDSADEFKLFIKSILQEAFRNQPANSRTVLDDQFIEKFTTQSTMVHLLKKYHKENGAIISKNVPISHLRYTPWVTLIGNNPEMVLKVYHETDESLEVSSIKPQNATELLKMIYEKIEGLTEEQKTKYLTRDENFLPIRIQGVHTFSLLASHSSMKPFFKKKHELVKTIREKTIKPGMETAQLFLSPFLKEKILQCTYELIGADQTSIDYLTEKFRSGDQEISVSGFRNKLMIELDRILPPTISSSKIQREIDLKISQVLPGPISKFWEGSIIHLADTNWQYGGNDIHYGIGINPGSGKLELFMVKDDGKAYRFLDQSKFFGDQAWEFYLHADRLNLVQSNV